MEWGTPLGVEGGMPLWVEGGILLWVEGGTPPCVKMSRENQFIGVVVVVVGFMRRLLLGTTRLSTSDVASSECSHPHAAEYSKSNVEEA